MIKCISFLTGVLVFSSLAASEVEFQSLTQRCEEALALSALPETLRERANVYVWRGSDFEKTISSDGGFHCLLQRNHPDSIIPECITATGEDSILQGIMIQTKLTSQGLSSDEVADKLAEMLDSGELGSPGAPGVNYMMSAYNHIYSSRSDTIVHIGPHTMFFAPNVSNDVIGGSFSMAQETYGFPFVAEAGPHSYIATFTDKSGETGDVEQQCKGQIELAPNDA